MLIEKEQNKGQSLGKKILVIITILLLIALIYIGFTAYQIYSLITLLKTQANTFEDNFRALVGGDCSKLNIVKSDVEEINSKVISACKNPLIAFAITQVKQIPFNCNNIGEVYSSLKGNYTIFEKACELKN